MAKNWSDLCNYYRKVIFFFFFFFFEFLSKNIFLFFFAEFELLMFHNNIVKILEKLNIRNSFRICLQVTHPTDFCIICILFYYGKTWKYLIFLKPMTRIKLFVHRLLQQWICIKTWQKFTNVLLLCEAPSKKRLSERCRKHSNPLKHQFPCNNLSFIMKFQGSGNFEIWIGPANDDDVINEPIFKKINMYISPVTKTNDNWQSF